MSAHTVTGYAFDADTYCTDCMTEDHYTSEPYLRYVDPPAAIFESDEFDYQPYCRTCGLQLNINLIHHNA
jgi:hypothetical protein